MEMEAESSSLRAEVESQKSLRRKMSTKMHALHETIRRIPSRIETAARKATSQAADDLSHAPYLNLKEKGVIPDDTRDIINDLVANDGVRPHRVVGVLKKFAAALGIRVHGNASDRSVRRVVKEGGLASKLQFTEAVGISKGVTGSSDGTTHKNINLESRRATVIGQDNEKQTFFLGIQMALNHTSETQLEGWEELIDSIYALYKTSSRSETADDARDFWLKVTGWHSDHAEDQKKLFRLAYALKVRLERERRGERALQQMLPEELAEVIFKISQDAVAEAGGITAWEQLTSAEQQSLHDAALAKVVEIIGQDAFEKLSDEEKQDVDLFIWGGCCMHKNLNVFKAGVLAMQQWWPDNNLPGPVKLYNRDNSAAVNLGEGTAAATRAEDRSCGGAIKVSSLAGAIFRHKDRKRGQQDTLRYFWDHETGFNICFPDTSNTRFQSHAGACEVIVLNMDLLLQFLVYVKENKISRALNHMEMNVQTGLNCWYTRHEFVVISLVNQNHDVRYLLQIRGRLRTEDNLLKLGELHENVKDHLRRIIANPKLITAPDATWETATLDGKPWDKPEVVYAALAMISRWELVHVDALVVAFCKGALEAWSRFDTEWAEDGPASKLSPANIERAWLEATNDGNEGELGGYRQAARISPNMSLSYWSALRMYKANKTAEYVKGLSSHDRQVIRAQVREEDGSGQNREMKRKQILHMKEVADHKAAQDVVRAKRVAAAQAAIAGTAAIESLEALEAQCQIPARTDGYLTVAALDLQLDWHIAHAVKESATSEQTSASGIPKAKSGANGRGNRDTRIDYLRVAIMRRSEILESISGNPIDTETPPELEPMLSRPSEAEDAGYESEEEWYSGR
ncbi:hypothetical protein FB451DRAFT_1158984 [Mycena latifolia]|nr:hypothetical protein FB451DRAFT_1158984 [Mycena latifolia]